MNSRRALVILVRRLLRSDGLTERPTVPRPNITTVDPFVTSATFHAAPRPNINNAMNHIINNKRIHQWH
jgi:hypothetical protein